MINQQSYRKILGFLQKAILFFVLIVCDWNKSVSELNNNLLQIRSWTYNWKMSFNPDPSKQAQEVIFSRKIKKPNHPFLNQVNQTPYQEYIKNTFLDDKLNLGENLKYISNKVNRTVRLLHKLAMVLSRRSLVIIQE